MGPRFSTVSLPHNRGKGEAVRNAMLRATGKVVAFTDADLPFELESLHHAYDLVRNACCEVVFGARDLAQSAHRAKRKLSRTLATWLFREVVKRLVSREVTDTQCGLKAFSLQAARDIFSRLTLEGFSFDAEVVFLTQRLGLTFHRIPVNLVREYGSTLSLRRHTIPMLCDIVGLWWRKPPPARAAAATRRRPGRRATRIGGRARPPQGSLTTRNVAVGTVAIMTNNAPVIMARPDSLLFHRRPRAGPRPARSSCTPTTWA